MIAWFTNRRSKGTINTYGWEEAFDKKILKKVLKELKIYSWEVRSAKH